MGCPMPESKYDVRFYVNSTTTPMTAYAYHGGKKIEVYGDTLSELDRNCLKALAGFPNITLDYSRDGYASQSE